MGKSVRKYRKNRDYEYIPPPSTASPYDIHDGKGARHVENDMLTSPREFIPLDQLSPGVVSPWSVTMAMVATSVGAMVVVLPYAILQGGFISTIALIVFTATFTHLSRTSLVSLGVEHGIYSFQGLAKLAFGSGGAFFVGLTQVAASLGLIIANFVILFEDVPVVLGHLLKMDFDPDGRPIVIPGTRTSGLLKLLCDRFWFPEVLTLVVVVPYCLCSNAYKRAKLAPTLVVGALLLAVIGVIRNAHDLHADNSDSSQGHHRDYMAVPTTVFQAFGIVTTVLVNQHHAFHAFYALRDRSTATFSRVSFLNLALSLGATLGIGIGAYVSFLGATKDDILHNYDFTKSPKHLYYWMLVPPCAVVGIAMEIILVRHSLQFLSRSMTAVEVRKEDVLFASQHAAKAMSEQQLLDEENCAWTPRILTMLLLLLLAQVAIFFASSVATVLSLTGGIAGIALCFILPAACLLKLPSPASSSGGCCSRVLIPCLSIAVGIIGSIACIITTVIGMRGGSLSLPF